MIDSFKDMQDLSEKQLYSFLIIVNMWLWCLFIFNFTLIKERNHLFALVFFSSRVYEI